VPLTGGGANQSGAEIALSMHAGHLSGSLPALSMGYVQHLNGSNPHHDGRFQNSHGLSLVVSVTR